MSTMDIDLDIKPFEQLKHASIGYQSLTDVPTAITYSEDNRSFKVPGQFNLDVFNTSEMGVGEDTVGF